MNSKIPQNMKKIAFIDIDGVLTNSPNWIAGSSPKVTNGSIKALKSLKENGFTLVFITARSAIEYRLKKGFEYMLKKNNLDEGAIMLAANGIDQATYAHELKMKDNKVVYKNGNAIITKRPAIKRETFGELDKYMLYKIILGREIKQELKYAGFKIKPARSTEMVTDSRIAFELATNDKKTLKRAEETAWEIAKKQKEIFDRTKKFGSPVDLMVYTVSNNVCVAPAALGKHFGVLRALKLLGIFPKDKILGYAFGDRDSDAQMSIRKDIKFIKVKNNKHFVKEVERIINDEKN